MSVIVKSDLGWFIDHQKSIDSIYANVTTPDSCTVRHLRCKPDLFAIHSPFVMDSHFYKTDVNININEEIHEMSPAIADNASGTSSLPISDGNEKRRNRKRKRKQSLNDGEKLLLENHSKVKTILETALDKLKRDLLELSGYSSTILSEVSVDNNISARRLSEVRGLSETFRDYCNQSAHLNVGDEKYWKKNLLECENHSDIFNQFIAYEEGHSTMVSFLDENLLIPPKCGFLMSDINFMEPLLADKRKYDCIVMDPPWENKSAKRKKTYQTLSDFDMFKLPVRQLCSERTLILVWVTNKMRLQNFVKKQLFPKWNVEYLTEWYWLKVTKSLVPIYDMDDIRPVKRPYETIIVGCSKVTSSEKKSSSSFVDLPANQVITSIPCSSHSRKPPLDDILKPFLPDGARCLELFARCLHPGWISWGNEVLTFQQEIFFDEIPD